MGSFESFEDMAVWKESRILNGRVREICRRPAVKRDFAFIDQITRSVRSISANIAEGSDALSAGDFIKFLGYAKRSAAEVRAHLYDARDEGYVTQEEFVELTDHTKKIGSMIAKLIHYLQTVDPKWKRTWKKRENESTSNA